MSTTSDIYRSARMAAAYAFTRPPVHRHLVARIANRLPRADRVPMALDIGCGAGLSTAAASALAHRTVGLEPHTSMLAHVDIVAPEADFVGGRAEALPFGSGRFHLITAAGSLNYADIARSMAEISRVLVPGGDFVPYDFSAGRRLQDDARLDEWFTAFLAHFPSPPGYALDLRALPYVHHGLLLTSYEELTVSIPMRVEDYVRYVLGEAGVEAALANGQAESDIRRFCESGLAPIFGTGTREVLFDAQIAYSTRMFTESLATH